MLPLPETGSYLYPELTLSIRNAVRESAIIIILIFVFLKTNAQNYLIRFSCEGDTSGFSFVKVNNLTNGKTIILDAGDILHLKSSLGISTPEGNNNGIQIFPNPMIDQSILTFVAPEEGNTVISIADLSGKTIHQINKLLSAGKHSLQISGIRQGIYFLKVSAKNYSYTTKLVSHSTLKSRATIEYISFYENTRGAKLKSESQIIEMQYTEGDLLLYEGFAGQSGSIVTDVPTSSKIINFTFLSCTDFEGNTYPTVKLGAQTWMAENLKTSHFDDGTEIALVESNVNWHNLSYTDKAYCAYDNSSANANTYGLLYTWAAAMNGAESCETNPSYVQGVCPCGWHLPSDEEWVELEMFLGMSYEEAYGLGWRGTDEGDKLKSNTGWFNDGNGTNSSGFSALPGGSRTNDLFSGLGKTTCFWSTTEYFNITYLAFNRSLSYLYSQIGWFSAAHYYGYPKNYGLSVRCVKD